MEEEAKPAESTATQFSLYSLLRLLFLPRPRRDLLKMMLFSPNHPPSSVLISRFSTLEHASHPKKFKNLLMELCKQQMTAEKVSATRSKNAPAEKPQDTRAFGKPSESKFPSGVASEKQRAEDGQTQGTYIVGRSAFGWNFIIFVGEEPVYYGITKESF
ncbi:hypothetical protein DVH24_014622 [Malus domestica]|uniref:Uncharacterized protein n=1 Tax=Malus domestica TaxID=3750 RepID=A0A498KKS2_MALDO|nr:hypothetical protein DVH24_014622 [Malus domestica]